MSVSLFQCPRCQGWHFNVGVDGTLQCVSVTRHTNFEVRQGGCGWRGHAGITLTKLEAEFLSKAMWEGRSDIWQTARVSEYNLTGKDPLFPDDKPNAKPSPPMTVTRAGLDESYRRIKKLETANAVLRSKIKAMNTQSPDTGAQQESPDTGAQQALPLNEQLRLMFIDRPESRQLWSFQGPNTVLHEAHDDGCTCSYCRGFASKGRFGLELPADKGKTSWRVVWLKLGGKRHYLRWTLPRMRPRNQFYAATAKLRAALRERPELRVQAVEIHKRVDRIIIKATDKEDQVHEVSLSVDEVRSAESPVTFMTDAIAGKILAFGDRHV